MISQTISKISKHIFTFPDRFLEKIKPSKPYDFLKAQGDSFKDILPYVAFLDLERPTCLLNDGSLGVIWELGLIPHESTEQEDLIQKLETISQIFNCDKTEISFQIIFDSEPCIEIKDSNKFYKINTSPEYFLNERLKETLNLAFNLENGMKLMQRRSYLTVRISSKNDLTQKSVLEKGISETEQESKDLSLLSQELRQVCDEVEYALKHSGIKFKTLNSTDFLSNLRGTFHSISDRKENKTLQSDYNDDKPFSTQVLKNFLELTPNAVGTGDDVWEVLSVIDQPSNVYIGMCSKLLTLDIPFRFVLNIRRCADISDLEQKKFFLKNANDSFGELQREEIKDTQDRMARGESLLFVSMHMFIRNQNLQTVKVKEDGLGRSIISKMKTLLQTDFILEKYAAPALFFMSLPFCYSKEAASFSGREKRVLSKNVAPYLPLLGGFQGTKTPFQLMLARSGDAVWINPFDSETSPHVAVLASSGGGKSFFAQNMMMSFFASFGDKKPLLFIIDKKTSYEIFAQVIGEEFGSQIVKPPEYFPNIFKGKIDEYRLPIIVGILKTAISLVTKDPDLGAIEDMVLSQSVKETFEQNELDATTEFKEGSLQDKKAGKIKIPRLSDVVHNFFPVCSKSQISKSVAEKLNQYLAPFLDNGSYKNLFNKVEYGDLDPESPGVSLFDIDFVANHPVLSTLTTQMILSEILRQIRRPENIGRPGMLVIEEVGVLSQGSAEIVQFIQDAWKTFRKLGFCCMGLTNEVDDYVKKPGAREIWNVSPNKIILKMTNKDLQKAIHGELNHPPLIEDKLVGQIIGTLKKEDGKYSQGFWWSDECKGSFIFVPTGYDYWCASSKPIEVNTVYEVAKIFKDAQKEKPFFEAINWLAQNFPLGIRSKDGTLKKLSETDIQELRFDL